MLPVLSHSTRLCDGVTRREWLRLGAVSAGVSLPQLLHSQRVVAGPDANDQGGDATSSFGVAKRAVQIFLLGGPPQHETWDPKPAAPVEVRGPLQSIASSVPGLRVGELMPLLAMQAHQFGVLRAVTTFDNEHSSSGYYMLTGRPHTPQNVQSFGSKPPNDFPCFAALYRHVSPRRPGLPSAIALPDRIWNDGMLFWPGQDGGFLGRTADPWVLDCDPSRDGFGISELSLPPELPLSRFDRRQSLLQRVNRRFDAAVRAGGQHPYSVDVAQAFDMLTSPAARKAFDLSEEPTTVRERYGYTRFGQSLLLARRLLEADVPLVQVNWTRIPGEKNSAWDTHREHTAELKRVLMPVFDQAVSAFMSELTDRGLIADTVVSLQGEFGRSPRFNPVGGRDHWGSCFSVVMAGAGIRGGTVHGESDAAAAFPVSGRVLPEDIAATLFHCLGIDPATEFHDPQQRPFPLSRGQVIREILA